MPTQLELQFDDTDDEELPFKYAISSYGIDYDVEGLVKRLRNDDIYIPPFQRRFVWELPRQSKFIESLLLGLPVPGVFLSKDDSQRLLVIDGQQRLRSLLDFYGDPKKKKVGFALIGLQSRFNGLSYNELTNDDRRRLDDSVIHATVVKQDEPGDDGGSSIYLIFQRLNSGGIKLQPQEIRAALYHGNFNDLLDELNHNPVWRELYGRVSPRKKDEEQILRFFAFYYRIDNYRKPMNEFLNIFMYSNKNIKTEYADELRTLFNSTVDTVFACIGEKAFKPKRSLNVAVLDSIMVGIGKRIANGKITNSELAQARYFELLRNEKYNYAINTGTSDEESVRTRFSMAIDFFTNIS